MAVRHQCSNHFDVRGLGLFLLLGSCLLHRAWCLPDTTVSDKKSALLGDAEDLLINAVDIWRVVGNDNILTSGETFLPLALTVVSDAGRVYVHLV